MIAPLLAVAVATNNSLSDTNLLKQPSPLPYQLPQFDKISDSDIEAAIVIGQQEQLAQVDAIIANPEPATFDNTLTALELSGALLSRGASLLYNLGGSDGTPERLALMAKISPLYSEHQDNIYLNPALYQRFLAMVSQQQSEDLSAEQRRLIEVYQQRFERAGATLSPEAQQQVRQINKELSSLTTQFGQNVLQGSQADGVLVTERDHLAGLTEAEIQAAQRNAHKAGKEGYLLSLVNTTRQPYLSQLSYRPLREKLWRASAERSQKGAFDNSHITIKIAQLRQQKAALFGLSNWAQYQLQSQMAQTPEAVQQLLGSMVTPVLANANKEAEAIRQLMRTQGQQHSLEPWDWAFYAEQVRQAQFQFDPAEVAQYFPFERVLEDGVFFTMNRLFGITFKARPDLIGYHPDVLIYEIFNADGSPVGLFLGDYFARTGKRGGAWMNDFVAQSKLLQQRPVIVNVMNIPKAAAGEPQLVSFDDVTTMFHEFGHAVHGLFSDVTYLSLAGTNVARDFVEFPSTFQEDWAYHPEVISNYAKHYQSDQPIPPELLNKVLAASQFNNGFDTLEYLASALLDMAWHSADGVQLAAIRDINAFEQDALSAHGVAVHAIPPRYKSSYFSHVFSGGYSAGYYAYLWSEILAADAFAHIQTQGGLNRAQGDAFRQRILALGNSQDLMTTYQHFRGSQPTTDALLKRRGIQLEK